MELSKIKTLTRSDAYNLAKGMIRVYVERGDTVQDLKSGSMGCTLGDFIGFGSIGGLFSNGKFNTDYIFINFDDGREFVFKLKAVFDDIKSKQETLF